MNDESKKLELFYKKCDVVKDWAGKFEPIWGERLVRRGWLAAFEEVLRIVDENSKPDQCSWEMLLENVRRAILDELGLTSDAAHESFSDYTTRRAWEVVMPTKQRDDYCDCRYDSNCANKMRGRCASTPNLEREERLKSRDKVLADAQKSTEDYAALLQANRKAARKFYGVQIRDDGRVELKKKQEPTCDHEFKYDGSMHSIDFKKCGKCGIQRIME